MLKKIIILLLLALLLVTIGLAAFTQTTYFKDQFKEYLIKKSPFEVNIGEIEGMFPFWMQLKDVSLSLETGSHVTIEETSFTVSPFALLIQKLTFIHLHVKGVSITTTEEKLPLRCPMLPVAFEVYSLEVENLVYNNSPPIHLCGSVDIVPCGGPFFINLNIQSPQYNQLLVHLNLNADALTQKVGLIANLRNTDIDLWTEGTLSLEHFAFLGTLYGEGKVGNVAWSLSSPLEINRQLDCFGNKLELEINTIPIQGEVALKTELRELTFEGILNKELLHFTVQLPFLEKSLFALEYAENQIQGEYSLQEKKAEIDIKAKKLEKISPILQQFFDFEEQTEGELEAVLSLSEDEITCKALLTHFSWNDLYLSNGHFDSHWQKERPLAFTIDLHDIKVLRPSYEVLPLLNIQAEGTLSDKMIKLEGTADGWGEEPFVLTCRIPTHLTMKPFSYSIDEESLFSIKFSGHGSIDPLLAFLENASLIVQGELDANIEISGLWNHSQITGYLIFSNGRIQNLMTGAVFQNVEMKVKGEENQLTITSLTAQDFDVGRIEGKGAILWNSEEHFPFHIDLKAHHFLLFALDPFTASTDALLSFSGNFKKTLIKGEATLVKGLITIPNKLPVNIPSLEVTYINSLPELCFDHQLPPSFPIEVEWDVSVHVPRKLEIEGRGFFSEWKGEMKIGGKNKELNYTGELTLHQGRFDFARHNFHLSKGKIRIEGIKAKDFFVDVEGTTEVGTLVVFLNVKGYLNTTKMTFTSTPPMSTEQIFSRLLFDSDLNELTPFQACRLAKFLVTLSGKYAGPSAFDNFKDTLGIDVFDITRCDIDAMDFTFQVGKYISQGTYVGINKSISGDFDSIEIQTRLYQDFFLQANYGGSLNGLTPNGGKIIFKWYKTY